ncbi:phosphatase PAP2 family protein [Steroidobacter gossypii]|nr:phosphatase PAP2 family protein [Steroidobacter gossypii]
MSTAELTELIATHLWAVLSAITVTMLLLTWLLWSGLQRFGAPLTALLRKWIDRVRPHAKRLSLPSRVHGMWRAVRQLGIQVLVSIAVAVAACIGFAEIADEIAVDEDLGRFDTSLSDSLSRHASDAQLRVFAFLTDLGDKRFLIPLGAVVALYLMFRRRWFLAAIWAIATAGGGLLNTALKAFFERARPEWLHEFAAADGFSFPSGHSSGAFIVYGLLAYLAVVHSPQRFHVPVAIVAMALIVCVGFSRVILQVHYFSDVLGGYAFGAAWVAAWIAGLEAYRRRQGAIQA